MENYTVYIAPRFFEQELENEIKFYGLNLIHKNKRFFLVQETPRRLSFAQDTWLEAFFMPFESITDASKKLKSIQRNWQGHFIDFFRRSNLILEKLPPIKFKQQVYGENHPYSNLGGFTLWDNNTLLLSPKKTSPFPDGECLFMEDKYGPPSRAYLKLWEIFTITNYYPKENQLAVDLGASPGGWTWVMANHKAKTFAIDKANLADDVAKLPNVDFCKGSGFSLEPKEMGKIDWLLSDMICYPEKLYDFTMKWLEDGQVKNIVFTVKLQGSTNYEILNQFKKIENSSLIHLSCNKHELTWIFGEINLNYQKSLT